MRKLAPADTPVRIRLTSPLTVNGILVSAYYARVQEAERAGLPLPEMPPLTEPNVVIGERVQIISINGG